MEFNEKLQQLRKQHQMTQEQLADLLFVSRTAVSKWESGKGYPNIESLKSLSKLFSVSIDELLSGDELIVIADTENSSNMRRVFGLIYGVLDMMGIAFIILPLYGKLEGTFIRAVNLLAFTNTSQILLVIYWVVFAVMIGLGILQVFLSHFQCDKWRILTTKMSFLWSGLAIILFSAVREPYVTALLFVFFAIKGLAILKEIKFDKR